MEKTKEREYWRDSTNMKQAIFHQKREYYGQDKEKRECTLSSMFRPDSSLFGYVLEDVVRGYGIKSKKYTAIPATKDDDTYHLSVEESPKYGKVVTVWTHWEEIDGVNTPILEYGGVRFAWIRVHGGNDADDTEGCLLANKYRTTENGKMAAWSSLKDAFAEEVQRLISEGYDTRLRITNMPQEA